MNLLAKSAPLKSQKKTSLSPHCFKDTLFTSLSQNNPSTKLFTLLHSISIEKYCSAFERNETPSDFSLLTSILLLNRRFIVDNDSLSNILCSVTHHKC
ncbi:unnamed protein product [Rotaria magnacalcarata]